MLGSCCAFWRPADWLRFRDDDRPNAIIAENENARLGLFRLWAVASVVWAGYCVWKDDVSSSCLIWPGPLATWCYGHDGNLPAFVTKMIGVPVLVAYGFIAIMWVIMWVVAGFREDGHS
jgi:hypothetical protein